ncbi:hypothetical protein [Salegentibacter sediminis]|uniref:hypothetical protein n=1 Tax=Salegentibacter sediminis TaxID=1930251 RepID=UPI0012FFC7FF|nr:hypothetical protein [Salegentibacter sediminis]
MKRTLLLLSILLSGFATSAQNKIKFESGKTFEENQLGIDIFYFVHHTFADAFYMTDLYKQLTDDEMYSILKKAYYSVTPDEKVLTIINQKRSPDARLAFAFMPKSKIGDILVLGTNFNSKSRVFEKEVAPNNSIYRWYAIKDGKLVYRKDLYSKEAEEENRRKNGYSLIGMYLFDDNFENDKEVKPLIKKLINSEKEDVEKLYGYLYLSEYWLSKSNLEKSKIAIKNLEKLFNESETIPNGYSLIVNMAKTEYEMMKRFIN